MEACPSIAYPPIVGAAIIVLIIVLIAAVYFWQQAEQRLHEYHELFRDKGE